MLLPTRATLSTALALSSLLLPGLVLGQQFDLSEAAADALTLEARHELGARAGADGGAHEVLRRALTAKQKAALAESSS